MIRRVIIAAALAVLGFAVVDRDALGQLVLPGGSTSSGGSSTAGGPLLPSSLYLGGASGNLSPQFYACAATNTYGGCFFETVNVVASLAADATAVLQFNAPENIPSGSPKIRLLGMANATTGTGKVTIWDGATNAGSSLGSTVLTSETQVSQGFTVTDQIYENKISLKTKPTSNQLVTILVVFNTSGWTLAAQSAWQASLVWE